MLRTTVRRIWMAGFPVGPTPGDGCIRCSHLWGEHILIASADSGDPLDGGHVTCFLTACDCVGTWDARHGYPDAATARQAMGVPPREAIMNDDWAGDLNGDPRGT